MLRISALSLSVALACSPTGGTSGTDGGGAADADDERCTTTETYCSDDLTQVLVCDPRDDTEMVLQTCPDGQSCASGACVMLECEPGQIECVDSSTERVCRDGFAWEERPCGADYRCLDELPGCGTPCILRVFILLDSSGSMGGDVEPTKWDQAREALATLMQSDGSRQVEFGLGVFPSGGGDCGVSEQVVYPLPEATPENVDAYFSEHSPAGNTPLLYALDLQSSDATAGLDDPAYANFLLLVSDGADTCWEENCIAQCGLFNILCIINCEDESEQEVIRLLGGAAAALRDESSIRTFVIGFGSGVSDEELTAIAENGGTVLGRWLPASDVDELSRAFDSVLQEMLECNPIVY